MAITLFGVRLDQLIYNGFRGQLLRGTLNRKGSMTRDPADVTKRIEDPNSAITATFEGSIKTEEVNVEGTLISNPRVVIKIFKASLVPAIVPQKNDTVTIKGATYTLDELINLSAAEVSYTFTAK